MNDEMRARIGQHSGEYILLLCQVIGKECLWIGILDVDVSFRERDVVPTSRYIEAPRFLAYGLKVRQGGMKVRPSPELVAHVGNRAVVAWLHQKEGAYPFLCEAVQSLLGYPPSVALEM